MLNHLISKSFYSLRSGVRGMADQAGSAASSAARTKLVLNLASPKQAYYKNQEVERVDLPAVSGDMGVLANHVPTIQQLKPGVIEVLSENGSSDRLFVSGGFAVVTPENELNINVIEAAKPDEINKEALKEKMAEAQRLSEKGSSEEEKLLAATDLEVYQALEKF